MTVEELVHDLLGLLQGGFQVIVDEDIVELVCVCHLFGGLGHALLDVLLAVGAAQDQPAAELLDARSLDENRQGLVAEILLEVYSSLDIYVEENDMVFGPNPLDLFLQRAVEPARVYFLLFHEGVSLDPAAELFDVQEVILDSVLLLAARRTRSR